MGLARNLSYGRKTVTYQVDCPLVLSAPLPPLPRRHRPRISPQAFLGLSRFHLQSFERDIIWRILSIPPAPAIFDECVIDVGAIPQNHIGECSPVLVLAVSLEDDIFPEGYRGRSLLRSRAEGLTFLRTVDAAEADTFSMVTVQD